ncbi:MAG: hypothetical protein Q4D29_10155 [Lachnospiraceae bacterium]|nr:hypothetical protein [Lachnospiraceae bacterium]
MGKDFKEKYERVCSIKDRAISLVEAQLNGNIENVDAKELGEVADIAKDMAELMELCAEAEYYHTVTEAMEKSSQEEKEYYMDKYIPEMSYYTPMGNYARMRDSRGRYMYTEPYYRREPDMRMYDDYSDRMYYSSSNNGNSSSSNSENNGGNYSSYGRSMMGDRSSVTRRTYMDMKDEDKSKKAQKLKEYLKDIDEEMTEMFIEGKASPEEKQIAKNALTNFINKL